MSPAFSQLLFDHDLAEPAVTILQAEQQQTRDRLASLQAEVDSRNLRSYMTFKEAQAEINLLRAEMRVYGDLIRQLYGEDLASYDEESED